MGPWEGATTDSLIPVESLLHQEHTSGSSLVSLEELWADLQETVLLLFEVQLESSKDKNGRKATLRSIR